MSRSIREKNRYSTDERYKLDCKVKATFRRMIKGEQKTFFFSECVGYDCSEFKSHISSAFLPGMTFDNYGEWHIDHKIPRIEFNYSSIHDKDFAACHSLENLQPMWAAENIKKGVNCVR